MPFQSSYRAAMLAIAFTHFAVAQEAAIPVPRMQVVPLPRSEAAIQHEGREIARYVFDRDLKRPFVYPLIGPAGRSVTRMGHPRDPNGHSHHNSVWISHVSVDGVDFWADGGKGRIEQKRVVRYEDTDAEALIQTENAWLGENDTLLMKEIRTLRFQPLEAGQWRLLLDLELSAPGEKPVTLGKTPFGFIGVRMAKTIGVRDGGGTIRNSEGNVNEKHVFWKPAKWVDYAGPITPEAREGILLCDHPANPNHPAHFHVRDDGWMGASLTFTGERSIEPGTPLRVRYGLVIHKQTDDTKSLEAMYHDFTQTADPPALPVPKKK